MDDRSTTLHFSDGRLRQEPGAAPAPELTVRTTSSFLDRWAAGEFDWDSGRTAGEVTVQGPAEGLDRAWPRWLAATDHRTGDLIVKLPHDRVEQLIADGLGKPFTPAGRTFREWVLIDDRDETRWAELIDEARTFVNRNR